MKINKFCIGDNVKHAGKLNKPLYGEIIAILSWEAAKVMEYAKYYQNTPYIYLVKAALPQMTTANGKSILMHYVYLQEQDLELFDWIDSISKEINK